MKRTTKTVNPKHAKAPDASEKPWVRMCNICLKPIKPCGGCGFRHVVKPADGHKPATMKTDDDKSSRMTDAKTAEILNIKASGNGTASEGIWKGVEIVQTEREAVSTQKILSNLNSTLDAITEMFRKVNTKTEASLSHSIIQRHLDSQSFAAFSNLNQ